MRCRERALLFPKHPSLIKAKDMDLDRSETFSDPGQLKKIYRWTRRKKIIEFLAEETKKDVEWVKQAVEEIKAKM